MPLDKIPQIDDGLLKKVHEYVGKIITSGEMPKWLDEEIVWLKENNNALYQHITQHAQRFAVGATMIDTTQIALSQMMEQVMLLYMLNASIQGKEELEAFCSWMEDKCGEIEGLGDVGKEV